MHLAVDGIEGGVDIGAEAVAVSGHMAHLAAGHIGQILNEILEKVGVHAGGAVAAGFLFIRQNGNGGILGGFLIDLRHEDGIGADAVIVAVGADHGAVETKIPGLEGGNGAQLGGEEVLFHDAVLFKQQLGNGDLDLLGAGVIPQSGAADEDIELFALDAFGQRLLHLVSGKVRQQIGDAENGIALFFADGYGQAGAVLTDDRTVQRQRDGGPLVLLDAAVVVGLEEALLALLIQGPGLEVQTGAVDMSHTDADAFGDAAAAEGSGDESLAAVIEVDLIPCLVLLGVVKGDIAGLFQHGYGSGNSLALGLGGIQEGLVALAKIVSSLQLFLGHGLGEILGVHQQLLAQLLALGFFTHGYFTPFGFLIILWIYRHKNRRQRSTSFSRWARSDEFVMTKWERRV